MEIFMILLNSLVAARNMEISIFLLTNFVARNMKISMFLLTNLVVRNMEISMFLATISFNKLIRRNVEISMFLATIPFNQLRRGNMEIFMFFFPCTLRQSWLKKTWKLLTRSAWKFPLSTFYRKDILKILIFLTDCLIFCKEESFEAFQLQKNYGFGHFCT